MIAFNLFIILATVSKCLQVIYLSIHSLSFRLAVFLKEFPVIPTVGQVGSNLVWCLVLVTILEHLIDFKLVTITTLKALKNSELAATIVLKVLMLVTIGFLIKVVASKEFAFVESTSNSKQEGSTILEEEISNCPKFEAIDILEKASIYSEMLISINHLQQGLTNCITFDYPKHLDYPMMADIME